MFGIRHLMAVSVAGAFLQAKYETKGTVVTLDLEDGNAPLSADLASYTPEVQQQIAMFGLRTLVRNATAGKLEDDVSKARSSVEQRLATFSSGKFTSDAEAKAKTELSDEERSEVIRNVIVMAKKAKGDTRDAATIAAAFNALPSEQKQTILGTLQKVIDKQIKAKLREKKQVGKAAGAGDATAMQF